MVNKKFSLVRGRAMRATRLDGCGNPVLGYRSQNVTEGFISVGLTANTEAGEAISVTNAAGKVCVQDTPPTRFVNYGVEIAFCGVDPSLVTMLTGQPVVLDADGNLVGLRQNSKVDVDGQGFALELWSGVPTDACEGGSVSYGYILLPFIKGGVLGDFTVENAAINFTLTGATTRDGSGWGVGPYNVTLAANDSPGPLLEAIDTGDHLHLEIVTVPPPALTAGTVTLGTPITGYTAGTPGTSSGSGFKPSSVEEANALAIPATPSTSWTTGQYVTGSTSTVEMYWNGTTWVSGRKP